METLLSLVIRLKFSAEQKSIWGEKSSGGFCSAKQIQYVRKTTFGPFFVFYRIKTRNRYNPWSEAEISFSGENPLRGPPILFIDLQLTIS